VDGLARSDAEQNVVRSRIVGHQVVCVVGSNQRHTGSLGKINERLSNALLSIKTMLLNLEEVIPFTENLFKLDGSLRSFFTLVLGQVRRRNTRHARRETDQSFTVLGEEFFIDARFVIKTFGVSLGGQSHE